MPKFRNFLPRPPSRGLPILRFLPFDQGGTIYARDTLKAERWRWRVLQTFVDPELTKRIFGESWEEMVEILQKGGGAWGVSTYDPMKLLYDLWFECRKEIPIDECLSAFGVKKVKFLGRPLTKSKGIALEDLKCHLEEEDETAEERRETRSEMGRVKGATTYDVLFNVGKGYGWDLWSAANLFEEDAFEVTFGLGPPTGPIPPGAPTLTAAIFEGESYPAAVKLALAKEFGFIRSEESYKGFST